MATHRLDLLDLLLQLLILGLVLYILDTCSDTSAIWFVFGLCRGGGGVERDLVEHLLLAVQVL